MWREAANIVTSGRREADKGRFLIFRIKLGWTQCKKPTCYEMFHRAREFVVLKYKTEQFCMRICQLCCCAYSDDDCTEDAAPLNPQTEQIRYTICWKYSNHVEDRVLTENALGKCWNSVLTGPRLCVQPLNSFFTFVCSAICNLCTWRIIVKCETNNVHAITRMDFLFSHVFRVSFGPHWIIIRSPMYGLWPQNGDFQSYLARSSPVRTRVSFTDETKHFWNCFRLWRLLCI
jgi:hypothetical protein